MLNIDTTTYMIEITRGDSASIVFSAVDASGKHYVPSVDDKLTFAVAKKVGAEPIFDISSVLEEAPSDYVAASPTEAEFNLEKGFYYTESGGTYTQCESTDSYSAETQYYIKDYSGFWTINISSADTNKLAFKDYVYDVQLESGDMVETIIGKTDTITPVFRVWGEVAKESADEVGE